MRQHFELGQFLRKRYKDFLNESYDRHEVGDGFYSVGSHDLTFTQRLVNSAKKGGSGASCHVRVMCVIPTGAGIP